jgi:hypothetical protein
LLGYYEEQYEFQLKCTTDVFATYSIADSIVHTNSFIILSSHKITETSNTEQSPLTRYCIVISLSENPSVRKNRMTIQSRPLTAEEKEQLQCQAMNPRFQAPIPLYTEEDSTNHPTEIKVRVKRNLNDPKSGTYEKVYYTYSGHTVEGYCKFAIIWLITLVRLVLICLYQSSTLQITF